MFSLKLKELLSLLNKNALNTKTYLPCHTKSYDLEIKRLVSDSRKVELGDIFACVTGDHFDGHNFAKSAVESGASALICERQLDINIPQIICDDVRRNMGIIASLLYQTPVEKLLMFGLTGTNGKTTTSFMLKSILEYVGIKTGLLGTIYYDDGRVKVCAEQTTPEASDLQEWLCKMLKNECRACVMEVSSHALVQGRVEGILYDRVGFSNLTVDHLDYHESMESYFLSKKILFDSYTKNEWKGIVNLDDEYGKRIINEFSENIISFGTKESAADFFAVYISASIHGTDVEITTPNKNKAYNVRLPLLGDYNIHNALQALAMAYSIGIDEEKAIAGLLNMEQIPGRLERYIIKGMGSCVIDFAHSPDSLENVLTTLRAVCEGNLHVVFGAGGDRDKTKRPLMGEIATKLADRVIITSDNPRSEDPATIASEVEVGARKHSDNYRVIVDRREAIAEGLRGLSNNDVLLLAGRGHEPFQILKDGAIPFLDRDELFAWCEKHNKEVYR